MILQVSKNLNNSVSIDDQTERLNSRGSAGVALRKRGEVKEVRGRKLPIKAALMLTYVCKGLMQQKVEEDNMLGAVGWGKFEQIFS